MQNVHETLRALQDDRTAERAQALSAAMTALALAPILLRAKVVEGDRRAQIPMMESKALQRAYRLKVDALAQTIQVIEGFVGRARLRAPSPGLEAENVIYEDDEKVAYVDEWRGGGIVAMRRERHNLRNAMRDVEADLSKAKLHEDGRMVGIRPMDSAGSRKGTTLTLRR